MDFKAEAMKLADAIELARPDNLGLITAELRRVHGWGLAQRHEWFPIETAPTIVYDTNKYLVAHFYNWQDGEDLPVLKKMAWCHVASYSSQDGWSLPLRGLKGLWGGASFLPLEPPTHWQCLPAPLAADGGQGA